MSTESASDFRHTIDQTLDQLENISPWELDNFDKALMQWSDQVPFGQSEFQNRYYVVQSHVTPWRQMRQAIMELQARTNSLQKVTIQYRRNLNDIARLEAERDAEENEFERYDIECQIEICKLDTQIWLNKLRQCKEEIEQFLRIIKERSGTDDIEAITKQFDDPNIVEEEEHKYWIARMAKQSAIDLLTTGRIQAGNLESMLQMNPEDQAAVTDLALTYSTALNHCIGKFKANAEEKVESMLEGRPPEMFDTAGVFTDYVENNVADRRLQSADKPKT
ncbi:hypothetical protein Sn250709_043 [Synechococcus phage S-RIM2]|uniref:Uncharacterized protein n=3 Tax=Nerrivikvirus srim2 TaxID=2734125 RepID=A0A1D7S134_9CAUD|nr:hypothetical protein SWTG_00016 [Synechococcus phage S-RIM2 R1_1999]AGH06937.1 hypothetical protein SWUG_00027 [Synechococcus phage S-RIM2 R9_2006]AON97556.1 hypothetical protein Fa020709_043 [Synechococcus phage S-RIM2]AGH07147.1 hypothetical protein SWTG_00016 [Synechococcus phage S-RIM2 R1_1999]AON97770.1 hypothetical protein Fa100709_043 [Synechococcus phage S-RIM2]AON97984.1 hypothetical protein Fa240709_043 [Synechococcus phage S-RIM2]